MELNKRLFNKDAKLFAQEMMKQLSLETLCTPDELLAGNVDMFRIGRFQITTAQKSCYIEYLTKEDFKNRSFDSYKSARKEILKFSTTKLGYIFGTDAKGKSFIKDTFSYCDSYPYFAVLLAYYEILTEKIDLTKKEKSIKKRIDNIINLDKKDIVTYKSLEKLFYEAIKEMNYDDLVKKIKMGKEAVEFYKAEKEKEEEKLKEEIEKEENLKKIQDKKKKKRMPLIISTAPVSLPIIGLKKLSNKFMFLMTKEPKKERIARQEKERQVKEEKQIQDVEEFKNF